MAGLHGLPFFSMQHSLINIAIPGTPRRLFTYSINENLHRYPDPGQRLVVPFGRSKVFGYYIGPAGKPPDAALKSVTDILDPYPLFDRELFAFLKWMAEYYFCNPADVFNAAIPPELRKIKKPSYTPTPNFAENISVKEMRGDILKKIIRRNLMTPRDAVSIEQHSPGLIEKLVQSGALKAGWVTETGSPDGTLLGYKIELPQTSEHKSLEKLRQLLSDSGILNKNDIIKLGFTDYQFRKLVRLEVLKPIYGLPDFFDYIKPRVQIEALIPNEEQMQAIGWITAKLHHFNPFLLYGITGSGKTLIYCHATRKVLKEGGSVLVLVPEIALAGTLLSYFKSFFKDDIALLHSGLKPKERVLIWQNISNGKYRIVIGARSAVFAPLANLGLIIVDEEHDESYKQDDPAPRFQARDAAVMRAKMADIPIVLGSATPSVESFYNTESGRYQLLKLTRRPEEAEIPLVRLVDLRKEIPAQDNPFFTRMMVSHVKKALKDDNQVILYLNRRGFSPRIKCTDCGYTPECPHCNISLTYHKAGNRLMCHFCGYINAGYDSCAKCTGHNFIYLGTGTQKIEDKISELFENARMVRLDSDSAAGRDNAHVILSDFAAKKYNLLLGTQMVTKGIDFPDVSLVGVLMADIGLDMPDFRASEKLFAKLIQVAGRSGRGIIPGEVIIQTFNPDLDLIDDAARQDYDTFYAREILSRKLLLYPPYSHLVNFRFAGKKEETVLKGSLDFRNRLDSRLKDSGLKVQILGPAPCPLYRLRGMYRRHLFVKTKQILKFIHFLTLWEQTDPRYSLPSSLRLTIDIDPYDMM